MGDLRHAMPIFEFISGIYKKNSRPNSKYYSTCKHYGDLSKMIVTIAFIIFAASSMLIAVSGVVDSLYSGELKPCGFFYFPGIHSHSLCYLIVLSLFNYGMVGLSIFVSPPGDILYFLLFVNFPMVSAVIQGHLEELNQSLVGPVTSAVDIKQRLLQYFAMHQIFNG